MPSPHSLPATFFQRASAWAFDVSLAMWPATLLGWMMTGPKRRALEAGQERALESLQAGLVYIQDLAGVYATQGAWTLAWAALIYQIRAGKPLPSGGG